MLSNPTLVPEKEIKKTLESIEMDINSNKIKIQLSYSLSNLSILVEENNTLLKNKYYLDESLSTFHKYDKYFKYFEILKQ